MKIFFNVSFLLVFALFSNLTFADGVRGKITIALVGAKPAGSSASSTCQLFYTFNNQTGLNITSMTLQPTFKESDGSIIGTNYLNSKRLKNSENVDAANYMDTPCNKVKTVKLNPIFLLFVDGKSRRDLFDSVYDNIIVSSKVSGVNFVK